MAEAAGPNPAVPAKNFSRLTHLVFLQEAKFLGSGLSRNRVSVSRDSVENDALAVRIIQVKWNHLRLAGFPNRDLLACPRIH